MNNQTTKEANVQNNKQSVNLITLFFVLIGLPFSIYFIWNFYKSQNQAYMETRVYKILSYQKDNIHNIIALADKKDIILSRNVFGQRWWGNGVSSTSKIIDTGISFEVVFSSDYSSYISGFDTEEKQDFIELLEFGSIDYFKDIETHNIKTRITEDTAEFYFNISEQNEYLAYNKTQVKFCTEENGYKGVGLDESIFLSRINNAVVDKDNNIIFSCPD